METVIGIAAIVTIVLTYTYAFFGSYFSKSVGGYILIGGFVSFGIIVAIASIIAPNPVTIVKDFTKPPYTPEPKKDKCTCEKCGGDKHD